MSRQVSLFRTHIPIGRITLFGLIGLLVLLTPAALLAAPPTSPAAYNGAPMILPVGAAPGSYLVDMAVDANGTVYVLDQANNQVIVETQDYLGGHLTSDTGPSGYTGAGSAAGTITCSSGITPAGFSGPQGITVTGGGTLYVADSGHSRVVTVNLTSGACSVLSMGAGSSVTLVQPENVAVNEFGDIFIADYGNNTGNNGQIVMIPWNNIGATYHAGVAYDIMDAGTNIIGNTYTCTIPCSYTFNGNPTVVNGVWNPTHIAWDAYDDILFIADYHNSRILAFGENWITSGFPAVSTGGIPGTTGTGVSGAPWEIETGGAWNWPQNYTGSNPNLPRGIGVDGLGNLYWTDTFLNGVYELPHPANGNWNSPTNIQLNITNGGGSYPGVSPRTISTGTADTLSVPNAIVVDQWGTVYVVDSGPPSTGHDRVIANVGKYNGENGDFVTGIGAINFYHVPMNSTSYEGQQLDFFIPSGTTVAAATVYTEGTEFLDFNFTHNATVGCYDGFTGPGTCYLWVTFKPTAPGLRRGAVALYTASGQQIANVPLFGTGTAPEAEFFPAGYGAAISTGSVATVEPMQIALDGNSNLYVANYSGNSVIEVPAAGGSAQLLASQTGGTATYPQQASGVAIDGSGNVYVSDHQGSQIWVTNPNAVYVGFTPMTIDMDPGVLPISEPMELNFDPAGNLYIADWGNGRVVEVSGIFYNAFNGNFEGRGSVILTASPSLGLGYALPAGGTLNPNGVKSVTGVAVDPLMNVYITDSIPGTILVAPQSINQIATGMTPGRLNWPYAFGSLPGVAGNFNLPQGLTTDGMGNLYIADAGNKRIIAGNVQTEIGTTFGSPRSASGFGVTVASNTSAPGALGSNLFGVTVDPWGNVFVPDYANNRIAAYYPTTPPTENFASTVVGLTSSDSPKTASLWNIGDEVLIFQAPTSGLNPSISTNFTYGATSTCAQISSGSSFLFPGVGCTIVDSFKPTVVGSITGNVVITDNNLYAAGSYGTTGWPTQAIPLAGTGLLVTPVSVVLSGTPNPVFVMDVVTYTATVTGTVGAGTPTGTVTFFDGLTTLGTATLNGSGVATLQAAPQSVIAGTQYINGTHSITAVYNGSAVYTTATSNTFAEVVQDFSFAVPNPSSAIVNPGGTAVFTFAVNPVNGTTFPAAIAFTVTGAPANSTVSLTPATSIASGGNPSNVVLTIIAPIIQTASNHQPENLGSKLAPISFALLLLPLLGVRRMRRTWQRYLALLIMLVGGFAATTALSGCSTTPSGYFGQGTTYDYTVTLTGTSGSLVHSASVTLTVN